MPKTVFNRTEKKYRINTEQRQYIEHEIAGRMCPDSYGMSTICSIYYDTDSDDLIRRSLEKPVYKEKLRVRSYGTPKDNSVVFIELKKKFKGTVFKRRVAVKYKEAVRYMQRGIIPELPEHERQIMMEIDWARRYYDPKPKVMVAYDRAAYFSNEDSELRLTFDSNIRCRDTDLRLSHGAYGELILPKDETIMEIKALGAIPLWLCEILTRGRIYPSSFSKYGTFYTNKQTEERNKCLQAYSTLQAQRAN